MSAPTRKKCSSESGRHKWSHYRNKIMKTQTMTTIHFSERGVYRCAVCQQVKLGKPVFDQQEVGAA